MSSKLREEREVTVERRLTFRERVASAAMLVFSLNLLVLTLLLVGWLAGWFHFAAGRGDVSGQWQLQLTLNTSRVADDLQETVDETRMVAGSLKTASEMSTVIGNIVQNDAAANRLTVQTEKGETVTAELSKATKVDIAGAETTPSALQRGDRVELVYQEKNGQRYAVKVARLEKD